MFSNILGTLQGPSVEAADDVSKVWFSHLYTTMKGVPAGHLLACGACSLRFASKLPDVLKHEIVSRLVRALSSGVHRQFLLA